MFLTLLVFTIIAECAIINRLKEGIINIMKIESLKKYELINYCKI